MVTYVTCLSCGSVDTSRATGSPVGDVPMIGYECNDCGESEIVISGPGRTIDSFENFDALTPEEIDGLEVSA